MDKQGNPDLIDKDKVQEFFSKTLTRYDNNNAVLDSGTGADVLFSNLYRDNYSKQFIPEYLVPGKNDYILDFGCGLGRITFFLSPMVKKIFGVDASDDMIQVAKKNQANYPNVSFATLEGLTIPLQTGEVDKVITSWVLQHISDEHCPPYFKEFYRVLKPGGKLVLFEQIKNDKKVVSNIHIFRTFEQYRKLAKDAGFTELVVEPVMRVPSRGMTLWNKFKINNRIVFRLLYALDRMLVMRKPQLATYFTYGFVFEKPKS